MIVKIKKFVDHLEALLNEKAPKSRQAVTICYEKIISAMFLGLEATSKELAMDRTAAIDDKEQVNMYILNIGIVTQFGLDIYIHFYREYALLLFRNEKSESTESWSLCEAGQDALRCEFGRVQSCSSPQATWKATGKKVVLFGFIYLLGILWRSGRAPQDASPRGNSLPFGL